MVSGERLAVRWRALRFLAVETAAAVVSLCLLVVGLVVGALLILIVGWVALPSYLRLLRWWAGRERLRAGYYRGSAIVDGYPPIPQRAGFDDLRRLLVAPSTRRDFGWVAIHAVAAPTAGLLALGLPAAAVNSLAIPFYWWTMPPDDPVSGLYPVTSWWGAAPMPLIAIGYAALGWWLTPLLARAVAALAAHLLAPGREMALSERVSALTASRAAALDAHAAELRRIERDLHDGAQNRLVAVVMMLGLAERSLRVAPEQALPQLLRAQDAASDALSELRTLVHDIYPPVLDELGLDGAVSALAGRSSVPCVLDVDELRRAPAAVEAAAYFVVAEALTNVAKHSGAHQVRVTIRTRSDVAGGSTMVIEVVDDGTGGAVERDGGGLAGIRRRVAAFEGTVTMDSPFGGPTRLEVELPCGF
ncbi:sensor histidine kinase [Rhodococcus sp. SGAir0479]|uniref:sensor histidine kinase n=1 Tax=Rhodococcus sp. SGAir0479 TaxID=2567884 RepID=UPI0010CD4C5C|nr:sensor histidine kinase [Rhodococcus sp. SGAir0479]QCQ90415.1 sensor histidine kinase [Rhodococcus sp. SGAir0479]